MVNIIELQNICKTYNGKHNIVNDLSLKIEDGEFVVLIGESGCGKTTTMKMINKLIKPSSGNILINNKNIKSMNTIDLRRNVGYVIQKVGLFPHMTIGKNIEIIPTLKKWDSNKKRKRAEELLELVNLPPEEYYDRYPNELSGGQQQRIGVARAIAVNPDIILMDEPFSALDPLTREQLQKELLRIQDELHKTIIFVTHDIDEAIKLADKIAVMQEGKIIQYDTPEEILKNPKNEFVENFIGKNRLWKSPEMVKAKDIMTKRVITVSLNRSSAQAIEIMKANNTNTLVVVNKESDEPQKPLGLVSKRELYQADDHSIKMKNIMNIAELKTVDEHTNMVDVLNMMSNQNLKHIFVIDKRKNLVGIITQTSILNMITEVVQDHKSA